MAEISPLAGLPAGGVFPLDFSPAFLSAVGAKGGAKRDEAIGLKYAFKPASITPDTAGQLETKKGSSSQLSFDTQKGSTQVFDVREEASKPRECVIVWNPETASFSIHPLSSTLNLTLNRNLSAQPQAKRKSPDETPTAVTAPKKKSRPSEVAPPPAAPARPAHGGKTLPKPSTSSVGRKSLPASVTTSTTATSGKYKSSEIIESDEDEGEDGEGEGEGEGDVDFATMLGAEMADDEDVGVEAAIYMEDDDDEEEEEEDDDDALGGAKLVVDAHTEWI